MGAHETSRLGSQPVTLEPLLGREPGDTDLQAPGRRATRIPLTERAVLPDRAIELDGVDAVVAA